jgi:alanine racemase
MTSPAPLRLTLDGDALAANWRWLNARSAGAACGAAVKANGYGLGARGVVARLAAAGCRDFFCATWAEAEALGALPDGASLSVLHGIRAQDIETAMALGARPVLNTIEQVARWRDSGAGRACDVMVDTGMNRLGLSPEEAGSGLLDGLTIETLLSHLACADEPDHALNHRQMVRFRALAATIPARRYSLANSAGILLGDDYAFDLTRPGMALYGGVPTPDPAAGQALRPVVTVEAQAIQVRDVPAGGCVGYGATWTANAAARVAILNIGYADGVLRQLAPWLAAVVDGAKTPLAGRISMDMVAIDIGDAALAEGDWVALDYDLPRLAGQSGLSQYELLTGLGQRFDRIWR